MSIKTFPIVIFASVENHGTQNEYLAAHLSNSDVLCDEEKKIVGMYKFVCAHEITKALPIIKKRRTIKTA